MKNILVLVLISATLPLLVRASESDEAVLRSCLRDYVNAFSSTGKNSEKLSAKVRQRCLSKEFLRKWDSIVSVDGTGADGILLAQDYFDSWKTDIKIQSINKKAGSAEALLGSGKEQQCLLITYDKAKSDLKISSVSKCAN